MIEGRDEKDMLDEMNEKFDTHIEKSNLRDKICDWSNLNDDFEWDLYENICSCEE